MSKKQKAINKKQKAITKKQLSKNNNEKAIVIAHRLSIVLQPFHLLHYGDVTFCCSADAIYVILLGYDFVWCLPPVLLQSNDLQICFGKEGHDLRI